jgi:hypothetical protein
MTPTERTLRELRRRGCKADICERWLAHVHRGGGGFGVRRDLFGWIDIIVTDRDRGIGAIQSTGAAFAEHWRKLQEDRRSQVLHWLECGGWAELWGWRKLKGVWTPRIKPLTLVDFDPLLA